MTTHMVENNLNNSSLYTNRGGLDRCLDRCLNRSAGALRSWLISTVLFAVAIVVTLVIFSTEPVAKKEGATKKTAMLVDTVTVTRQDFRPLITAMGVVTPAQKVDLKSRVSGEVIERAPGFVPGAHVKRGEVLMQLDPADYRFALQQAQSDLSEAEAALETEMGEQERARNVYQSLNSPLSEKKKALVLRQPQLKTAKARVTAARAQLAQAELNLTRTTVKAPFDAQVMARDVNLGSQVGAGDVLGRLIGVEHYWVEVSVPLSKLDWIARIEPDSEISNEPSLAVTIRDLNAWPRGYSRQGQLSQVVGELDEKTRMVTVLVDIKDPLGLVQQNKPLLAGSFVQAELPAKVLQQVIKLPRKYLRKNDTVWVMESNKLAIKTPQVLFRDEQFAYIAEGLEDGARVITTDLATVKDGADVRPKKTGVKNLQPNETQSDASVH